jgi:hypothetical protein
VRRHDLLKAAAAATFSITAAPRLGRADRAKTLVFVGVADLSVLDPFSASAALRRGEIDWWENPPRDLVTQVSGDRNITVVSHFATANGIMTFNHRYALFDNPAIRRAFARRGGSGQCRQLPAVIETWPASARVRLAAPIGVTMYARSAPARPWTPMLGSRCYAARGTMKPSHPIPLLPTGAMLLSRET